MKPHPILSPGDALLIVDVQNDFLIIISKATTVEQEAYSGFKGRGD
ncbi:MAG TPA: hypothetical protein VHH93_02455 [Gammaproteobacteria bacterium]|jgi:nicotinamidase-related amidase|nr:hypothetical protein [Gammaproteobacteria bacterium]